ncbi:MAG TPA: ATP-binding cassette domain-containing protein [Acetobacteraceae bacterium]|jgi:sulfonate transport system ATP-binding protein|nr:ATP-binding cassette domain-containing protein [Acetobacteraceae bacterium]
MSGTGGLSVTARGLSKNFGPQKVIDDLELHVPAGQFLAIVGRSGCGKSTLLRLLCGLETPSGGAFWIGDGGLPSASGGVVRMMFQEPRLLPWVSVAGNVQVGLGGSRADRNDETRVMNALDAVGLRDRDRAWPGVLSGGQKQRVALARALVSRPRILALDEPLGALDALTRIEMQELIEEVWLDQGFTGLLVTHDVTEALMLADRVVLIEHGAIAFDLEVRLPRPRRHGAAEIGALEDELLGRLLRHRAGGCAGGDGGFVHRVTGERAGGARSGSAIRHGPP